MNTEDDYGLPRIPRVMRLIDAIEEDEIRNARKSTESYWRSRLTPEIREQVAKEIEQVDWDFAMHAGLPLLGDNEIAKMLLTEARSCFAGIARNGVEK